jgi:hypothetical protein
MKTYIACIGEEAALAFRAENDDEAHEMIGDEDGSIQSDLKALSGTDETALWDGKSAIKMRQATVPENAEWERSRDQAIGDEEIDLDAGDDPDDWNVYLNRIPQTK